MKKGKQKLDPLKEKVNNILNAMSVEEMLLKQDRMFNIMNHQLFIRPPQSVEDSYTFGWLRGLAMMTDTMLDGKWYHWLLTNATGEIDIDSFPDTRITSDSTSGSMGEKMLEECMKIIYSNGYRVNDFIEWIGYALGISWFEKPRLPEAIWNKLYQTFNLDLLLMEPADYLSNFVSVHGQSGHLDYYPTPMSITSMMNMMISADNESRNCSQFEPCIGGAAMLLPSNSLNLIGVDLSLIMVKVASIQAFLYKPWMLYVPKPIVGVHADPQALTINRYFEFNVDTRIYYGNSLLEEYRVPKHIFEENSEWIDVYCHPLDLSKREIFKYEEDMMHPWESIPHDQKIKIVKAQAREIGWDTVTTNPPFNATLGKSAKAEMSNIEDSNRAFLEERKVRLAEYKKKNIIVEKIIQEVNIKISESKSKKVTQGQYEMVF
ncbi:hypothetical protein MUB24_22655 [Lederbergia sp. NSJ-179]|uniref:hypothetical protein n=1 Tax=Lederbergia sp. NSJ-179 TaxID=2931402 RepID=UPI001FD5643C|nr:hypothetical protein [Lederbergia sp. NSJ-179]MCJ7843618.1 hypothetical protein [Lederbergia sp. NSJ-179]